MFHAPWLRRKSHSAGRHRKQNTLRLELLENRLALSANALAQVVVNLTETLTSQAYGQLETFSVHVASAAANAATPTGIIDFMDGTTDLGKRARCERQRHAQNVRIGRGRDEHHGPPRRQWPVRQRRVPARNRYGRPRSHDHHARR